MDLWNRNSALKRWACEDIAGRSPVLSVNDKDSATFGQLDAPAESYGAVVFANSLVFANARAALAKAKTLVRKGGRIIAYGSCSPASPLGWASSMLRAIKPVRGDLPTLAQVEGLLTAELPGVRVQRVLGNRYYAVWERP